MSVDWRDLRGELPAEVRARLDDKRVERRLGRASGDVKTKGEQQGEN